MAHQWRIELIAFGENLDTTLLRSSMGDKPSRAWNRGDSIGKSARKYNDSGCALVLAADNTGWDVGIDIESGLIAMRKFGEAAANAGASVQLNVVIRTDGESYPSLNFDEKFIQALRDINASLDIDIIRSL